MPHSSLVSVQPGPPLPARSPLRPPPLRAVTAPASIHTVTTNHHDIDTDSNLDNTNDDSEDQQTMSTSTTDIPLTKRQHALYELLSSERAYASDLALIRDVHIPLALGQTAPISGLPITPPASNPSSRTQSTISDSSSANAPGSSSSSSNSSSSSSQQTGPPMSQEDVKIIFGNITEIALFSHVFCQALHDALGDLVNDHVGALFLRIIPALEGPYKQYITRHPTALTHLQQLPQTPSLTNYLTYTQNIASSLSHAWDLSSLLIKPVQRLLKYPLLLKAIIDETPESHSDKESLLEARKQLEEVARNVNEDRRRAEVVRDVLTSKKKSIGVGVAAQVNLTKMKSIRVPISSGSGGNDGEKIPEEAILVEKLQKELEEIEEFAQKFAKNVVDWAKMASNVVFSLRTWAIGFAKVIGLSTEQESEAFDAFFNVVEQQLMPLCVDLEAAINERVLKELAHLLMTMNQPLKLLSSMNDQEPYHYHLLNMEVSAKNRPPPTLLAASTNYLALRGQLAAELPTYLKLFHRGLSIFVHRLTVIQIGFYCNVRDRWGELWDMLRVEGEMNAGHEETIEVWKKRWGEISQGLETLRICHRDQIKPHPGSHSRDHHQHLQQQLQLQQYQQQQYYQESERGDERDIRRQSQESDYLSYIQQQEYIQAVHGLTAMSINSNGENTNTRTLPPSKYSPNPSSPTAASAIYSMMGSLESRPNFSEKKEKENKKKSKQTQASSVMSMLGALESSISSSGVASVGPFVSPPYPLAPRSAGHNSGHSGGGGRGLNRRGSSESLMSRGTARSPPSIRTIQPHPPPHPHSQKRRTSTGPVPTAEDYAEYETILREREKDKERERLYANAQTHANARSVNGYGNGDGSGYYPYGQGAPGLPRMKSMPLPHHDLGEESWEYADSEFGGDLFYQSTGAYNDYEHPVREREREEYEVHERIRERERMVRGREKERERAKEKEKEKEKVKEKEKRESRGRRERSSQRPAATADNKKRYSEHSQTLQKEKDKERSPNTSSRKRSGSIKSITSFFTSSNNNRDSTHSESSRNRTPDQHQQQNAKSHTPSPRDSWAFKPAKYLCRVIHACKPPTTGSSSSSIPLSYFSFPFFTLVEDDVYEVLQEAGHPSLHPRLPLIVDDGEDCLLLCRAHNGEVGWALASFLEPF